LLSTKSFVIAYDCYCAATIQLSREKPLRITRSLRNHIDAFLKKTIRLVGSLDFVMMFIHEPAFMIAMGAITIFGYVQ
jgi:DNA anti-recombination protein RmuC